MQGTCVNNGIPCSGDVLSRWAVSQYGPHFVSQSPRCLPIKGMLVMHDRVGERADTHVFGRPCRLSMAPQELPEVPSRGSARSWQQPPVPAGQCASPPPTALRFRAARGPVIQTHDEGLRDIHGKRHTTYLSNSCHARGPMPILPSNAICCCRFCSSAGSNVLTCWSCGGETAFMSPGQHEASTACTSTMLRDLVMSHSRVTVAVAVAVTITQAVAGSHTLELP